MHKPALGIILILIAVVLLSRLAHTPAGTIKPPTASQTAAVDPAGEVLAARTKSANCQINGPLQDTSCTPGAVFSGVTKNQVCTSGYAKSVRDVGTNEKRQVYEEYGIQSHTTGQYEVDHLVSLELGGSNDISNLWPEAASPAPGFHQKDVVENYLHDQVCSGAISLSTAQHEIATNWLPIYQTIAH